MGYCGRREKEEESSLCVERHGGGRSRQRQWQRNGSSREETPHQPAEGRNTGPEQQGRSRQKHEEVMLPEVQAWADGQKGAAGKQAQEKRATASRSIPHQRGQADSGEPPKQRRKAIVASDLLE